MKNSIWTIVPLLILAAACAKTAKTPPARGILFKDDVAFLEKHTGVVVLTDRDGAALVAVEPRPPGPGHDEHGRRAGRPELRLDQPRASRLAARTTST